MTDKLNFFVTTDIHMGNAECGAEDYEVSLANMKKIDKDAPLIIPGDLTTFSDPIWFKEIHQMLKQSRIYPVLLTLGNHDVRGRKEGLAGGTDEFSWTDMWKENWIDGVDSLDDPRFETYHKILPLYQEMVQDFSDEKSQEVYTHHVLNGYHFFMLCTELPLKDKCYLSEKQLTWLEEGIKAAREEDETKPIFVFSHQALNDTHQGSNAWGGFGDENDELIARLNKFQNLVFFSGHVHNGLGVTQALKFPFGYACDLASYCYPANGLKEKSIGYYVEVEKSRVTLTPYFLGDSYHHQSKKLPLYQKILAF